MEPLHIPADPFTPRPSNSERERLKRELDHLIRHRVARADAGDAHDIDDVFAELQADIDADDRPRRDAAPA